MSGGCRSKDFPGIEYPLGIERLLQHPHQVDFLPRARQVQVGPLQCADAVFGGNRTLIVFDHAVDDAVERVIALARAILRRDADVEVAVADVPEKEDMGVGPAPADRPFSDRREIADAGNRQAHVEGDEPW